MRFNFRAIGILAFCGILLSSQGCGMIESAAQQGVELGFQKIKQSLPDLVAENPTIAAALTGIRTGLEASGQKDQVIATLTDVAEDKRSDGGVGGIIVANLMELIVLLLGGGAVGGFVLGKRKATTHGAGEPA